MTAPDGTRRRGLFLCPLGVAVMLLPDPAADGETYLIAATAARMFGVAPPTLSGWVRKGYLTPVPGTGGRLFALADVARAEKQAFDAAVRTSGTAKRVQRHHKPARETYV